jgi:CheY-like chemotaxis protein
VSVLARIQYTVYTRPVDTSVNRTDQVMVIDDDAIMLELLPLLLGAEGHTVLTAESGDDALSLLAGLKPGQSPSVVLTDLKMPGFSPAAFAIRLRLACPSPGILLAMSASEPAALEAAAFDGFLSKPFRIDEYTAAVELARAQASGMHVTAQADAFSVDDSGRQSSAVPALDQVIYAKLFSVMGATHLPQMYTLFLEDAGMRVERMRLAVAGNDAGTFAREAHAIKGGCGMLGATELYSLASRMETGGFACSSLLQDFRPAFERLRRILEKRMNLRVDEQRVENLTGTQTRR